jgi:hypothetical protein
MHYPDEASEMFQSVIKLDPKNKDARTYYNITKKKIAEYRVKEKKIYGNKYFVLSFSHQLGLQPFRITHLLPANLLTRNFNEVYYIFSLLTMKLCHFVANMFDKFAARDAKNAAQAESSLNPDGKDVFTKAEEEAKAIFGDELATADAGKKLENEKTAATTNNIDKGITHKNTQVFRGLQTSYQYVDNLCSH